MKNAIVLGLAFMAATPAWAQEGEGQPATEEKPAETKRTSKLTIKDDATHDSRPQNVDVLLHLDFLFFGLGFGLGGAYAFPIVPDGFIKPLNDQFNIEVSASIGKNWWSVGVCDGSNWNIEPVGGVRWDFLLNSDWTVYMRSKFGYRIGFGESGDCLGIAYTDGYYDSSRFIYDIGPGVYWHLADGMVWRLETGTRGIAAGLDMTF